MAYAGDRTYHGQRTGPIHPSHVPQVAQNLQFHTPAPLPNGYFPVNQIQYQANDRFYPRYGPVSASEQHRPSRPQNAQSATRRAYAVAIPTPSAPATLNDGHHLPNGSQNVQRATFQAEHAPTNGHVSKAPTPQISAAPQVDYQAVLLSLADEYFTAAYEHGSTADVTEEETELQTYYKLIATGLGCLEAVLRHFKIAPEKECTVRLQYATVLYEETDNIMEVEEALSKGISLADRHHFYDLKYNMQHLMARVLFQKSSRAAFKFLEGVIQDAGAYQHVAWIYAFRFLTVSLHLELSSHQDFLTCLTQLRKIIAMASDYGDKAILAITTTLEALTCLRLSADAESIEQTQRALASVRSLQLDPKIGEMQHLAVLTSIVDLSCHLHHFDPNQVLAKMQVMQIALRNMEECKTWTSDGCFSIPLPSTRMPSCKSRSGVIRQAEEGSLVLMFKWMSKDDIYNLGFLLSGIALAHRNATDGQKSEHMLMEGIKRLDGAKSGLNITAPSKSLGLLVSEQTWRQDMICFMRLHLAFTLCARTYWSGAQEQQKLIQDSMRDLAIPSKSRPEALLLLSTYLDAVLLQGTGYLDKALNLYQGESLSMDSYRKIHHPSQLRLDISLLSALNALLIIRTPTHPEHGRLPPLLSLIEHLCLRNPNRQLQSAYHLIKASTSSSATILITKQSLQSALQASKQSDNKQLMCMVLNFMSWKFFRGVIGDQAEKSARASQTLAQKCMDGLWTSVAAGVLGDTLEAAGRIEEAKKARLSGEMTARSLPEKLQEAMGKEREAEDVVMMDDSQELTMFG